MALTVPNEGEVTILNRLLNKEAGASVILELFGSNTTPNNAAVLGDYTMMSGGGYQSNTIANTGWTVTGGSPSQANAAAVVFTFTSVPAQPNVYGYIVRTASKIVAVERLPSAVCPFIVSAAGESVTITPVITCASVTND